MISAKDAHEKTIQANKERIEETIKHFEELINQNIEDGYFSCSDAVPNDFVRKAVVRYFKEHDYNATTFWNSVEISW